MKTRLLLGAFVLAIILALGVWLGFALRNFSGSSGANAYNTSVVLRQVQTLSQLVTVKYVMEKVVVYEDVKWFPGGDNRVLMIAHGVVKGRRSGDLARCGSASPFSPSRISSRSTPNPPSSEY